MTWEDFNAALFEALAGRDVEEARRIHRLLCRMEALDAREAQEAALGRATAACERL